MFEFMKKLFGMSNKVETPVVEVDVVLEEEKPKAPVKKAPAAKKRAPAAKKPTTTTAKKKTTTKKKTTAK